MKIVKAPNAQNNTWQAFIEGIEAVDFIGGQTCQNVAFGVLFTSDDFGETISLTCRERQWALPFEAVEILISKVRAEKGVV
ncbi:MAG: hypothetical protein FWG61_00485 [Firmicutes bacterium]|nr:hypothetical protein [Bacillota bacterium]